jgi:hypothetical protein
MILMHVQTTQWKLTINLDQPREKRRCKIWEG